MTTTGVGRFPSE